MKETTDTILRQWTMLTMIPREPLSIGAGELRERLADEGFQVNVRTIQRDMNKLSGLFPLACESQGKANRWHWMREGGVMDIPGMDSTTALAFRLAEDYLAPLLPQATIRHLQPHFRRAREVLAPARGTRLRLWPDRVCRIARGPDLLPPAIRPEVHEAVYQALLQDKQLEVTYQSKEAKTPKAYPVHPLGLVFREGVVYLICRARDYEDIRHLALHRMSTAMVLEVPCRRPPSFNLHAYAKEQEELAYPVGHGTIKLKALFDRDAAIHLDERPLSREQRLTLEEEGRTLLQATVRDTLVLRWWLLGFGDKVTVLAPKTLREDFKKIAGRMASGYSR